MRHAECEAICRLMWVGHWHLQPLIGGYGVIRCSETLEKSKIIEIKVKHTTDFFNYHADFFQKAMPIDHDESVR